MKILLAPDKFKGTFTATEVCAHLRAGILESNPRAEVIEHPLADGGDGTLAVLLAHLGGGTVTVSGSGPRGEPVRAEVGDLPDGTLVLESASLCGLSLIPGDQRNPMSTTTYGLGAALREILSWGRRRVLVGLGGSATVDGGIGLARAFGFRFIGRDARELGGSGGELEHLDAIQVPRGWDAPARGRLRALCDVENPLTGPSGAAESFAPQKGASAAQTRLLASGLTRLARLIQRDLGIDVAEVAGGGAAGGLGAALFAFLGAELVPGAVEIMSLCRFTGQLEGVDLVVTGEGALDAGSFRGKVVGEVIRACGARKVRVAVVCGRDDGVSVPPGVQVLCGMKVIDARDLRDTGKRLGRQ